jgi:hypothetical protein
MSETRLYERATVEAGGIRIPQCPRCGTPNVIPRSIERGTFGECAGDDCDAWIAYDVRIAAVACDSREQAKYRFETEVYDE